MHIKLKDNIMYVKLEAVILAVMNMPYYEWRRLSEVIDRAYKSRANKVSLDDSAALRRTLELEFTS